jgi:hypothetical protein
MVDLPMPASPLSQKMGGAEASSAQSTIRAKISTRVPTVHPPRDGAPSPASLLYMADGARSHFLRSLFCSDSKNETNINRRKCSYDETLDNAFGVSFDGQRDGNLKIC